MGKILIIDDPIVAETYKEMLEIDGIETDVAYSCNEGWNKIQQHYYHVLILNDYGSKSKLLVEKLLEGDVNLKIIIVTPYGDEKTHIDWFHYHIFDCFKKPVDSTTLLQSVKTALERTDPIIDAFEKWVETNPIAAIFNQTVFVESRVVSPLQTLDGI